MAIDPTGESLKRFLDDGRDQPVVMLNLLRFRVGGAERYAGYLRHCPSQDASSNSVEGTQHSEFPPVPDIQNRRFWMSATSRLAIVRSVPNGGSARGYPRGFTSLAVRLCPSTAATIR